MFGWTQRLRRAGAIPPWNSGATIARHRLRFRVCHELGHTFFYERHPDQGPHRREPCGEKEERWCDDFARELLIPHNYAAQLPTRASSAFELHRRFNTSLEVAARALASAHGKAQMALWFWSPDEAAARESLIHQWSGSDCSGLRSWRNSHLVAEALRTNSARGPLPALRGCGHWSATAVADHSRRQVLVVASP